MTGAVHTRETGSRSEAEATVNATSASAPPDGGGLTVAHPALLLATVLAAAGMQFLDGGIVNTALPSIRAQLDVSHGLLVLVTSSYVLAYGSSIVAGSALGARFGFRRLFLIGVAVFTISSALCGAAPVAVVLVAFRFCQGVGAGCMVPQALSVIQTVFRGAARARAMAAYVTVTGITTVVGPTVGGLILGAHGFGIGWRALFYLNLPVGVVATIAAWRLLRVDVVAPALRFDLVGALLATVSVALVVFPLALGSQSGWPTWSIACLCTAPALGATTVVHQRSRARAGRVTVVDPSALRAPSLRLGLVLLVCFAAGGSSYWFVQPLYIQTGLGHSPLASALTGVPFALCLITASRVVPRLARRRLRAPVLIGMALMAVAQLSIWAVTFASPPALWAIALPLAASGIGYGLFYPICAAYAMSDVAVASAPTVSGVLPTVQQVASSVGLTVVGAIFFSIVSAAGRGGHVVSGALPGYADGFRVGTLVGTGILVIGVGVAFAVPKFLPTANRAPAPVGAVEIPGPVTGVLAVGTID